MTERAYRPYIDAALAAGAAWAKIDKTHAHHRLVMGIGERSRFVVLGSTNSDHRAAKNNVKWIKRVVRELQEMAA